MAVPNEHLRESPMMSQKPFRWRRLVFVALFFLAAYLVWRYEFPRNRDSNATAPSTAAQPGSRSQNLKKAAPLVATARPELGEQTAKPLSPSQRFAVATNYKALYDELSQEINNDGESRYFMGKALAACNLFTGFTLEQHERTIPPGSPNYAVKLAAFREMGALCSGFYGFKGPNPIQLWKQAAATGYAPAVAATLSGLDRPKAEAAAAAILERGDPEALERLLVYLEPKVRDLSLEVEGQRPSPEVAIHAWRLYACSRGADCNPFLFERCWGAGECGSPNFQVYLRDQRPDINSLTRALEVEIARAVAARDWRALGIVTTGPR